jgi:hypothetical protein
MDDEATVALDSHAVLADSSDLQETIAYHAARAVLLRYQGRLDEALASGREAVEGLTSLGATFPAVKVGFVEAAEAALALGDTGTVQELLAIPAGFGAGEASPFWRAQTARLGARLAAARAEQDAVGPGFEAAAREFRDSGIPFWLAVTLLEHAESLVGRGHPEDGKPLLAESREVFERLGAEPWSKRLEKVAGSVPAAEPAQA